MLQVSQCPWAIGGQSHASYFSMHDAALNVANPRYAGEPYPSFHGRSQAEAIEVGCSSSRPPYGNNSSLLSQQICTISGPDSSEPQSLSPVSGHCMGQYSPTPSQSFLPPTTILRPPLSPSILSTLAPSHPPLPNTFLPLSHPDAPPLSSAPCSSQPSLFTPLNLLSSRLPTGSVFPVLGCSWVNFYKQSNL